MNGEYQVIDPQKSRLRILAAGGLLAVVLAISLLSYFFGKVNSAASTVSMPVPVTIAKGAAGSAVTGQLAELKLLSSPWVFDLYVYAKGASRKIQAGEYLLDRKMSMAEIVDIITQGQVVDDQRPVTVIEGWTNQQIGERLGMEEFAAALATGDFEFAFHDDARFFNYQGFLFPDTYLVDRDEGAAGAVKKMLANFESKISEQVLDDIRSSGRGLGEVIIVASIVEKEVGRNTDRLTGEDLELMQRERRLVASVLYNRLKQGMPLQSDATVNYVTGKKDRRPLLEDTKVQSPYNTYQVTGLPPTPISNPGLDAIMAAIYPATSDYLYFLNSPDGTAYFARTLQEHNQNRAKYLE